MGNGDQTPTKTAAQPQSPAAAAAPSPFSPGQRIGFFRLIRPLGRGGFGEVWEAEQADSGRLVALKILSGLPAASPLALERFRREGRLAASISHERCVHVFGADEVDGHAFIAMELMPGGTLQDRLSTGGPVPARAAVEIALDVIEGLATAHAAGILHRDIKPSNIFFDREGRARIGDFGISRSLSETSDLTAAGSFIGTPRFASPEQARGGQVDQRSDLYSLGATLYALLSGRPPFTALRGEELLAQILTEAPPPLSKLRPKVPRGLRDVVHRLLRKDPNHRYSSYAALRSALLPYSSAGLSAGDPGRRLGALALDVFLLWLVQGALEILSGRPMGWLSGEGSSGAIGVVLFPVWVLLWEGLRGATPGKWSVGLRVATLDGFRAPISRIVVRTILFFGCLVIASSAWKLFFPSRDTAWAAWLDLAGVILLVSTMRRRNGYAGFHELLSGTRTRLLAAPESEDLAVPDRPHARPTSGLPAAARYGPFRSTSELWRSNGEVLVLARDESLQRPVWIHAFPQVAQPRPLASLTRVQRGRLLWLQGSRDPDGCWNAFEAPRGAALPRWIESRGRLAWSQTRRILLGLARAAADDERGFPPGFTLDHVWIDTRGEALLLDFPVESRPPPFAERKDVGWRDALRAVAACCLEGRVADPGEKDPRAPRVPLPEHVHRFLARLFDGGAPETGLTDLVAELEHLTARPTRVSRLRRVWPLAVCGWLLMLPSLANLLTIPFLRIFPDRFDRSLARYARATMVRTPEASHWPNLAVEPEERDAIRLLLSAAAAGGLLGVEREDLESYPHEFEGKAVEEARRDFPSPTPAQVSAAREIVAHHYLRALGSYSAANSTAFAFLSLPAVLLTLLLGGGPLLLASGVRIQNRNGDAAGRFRVFVRAVVAWSPWLALAGCFVARPPLPGTSYLAVVTLLNVVGVAAAIYAVARPERGIQDLLAGTYLVPR